MKLLKCLTIATLAHTLMSTFLFTSAHASEVNLNQDLAFLRISSEEGKTETAPAQDDSSTGGQRTTASQGPTAEEREARIKSNTIQRYHRICLGREASEEEVANYMTQTIQELMALRKSAECNTEEANARREEMRAKIKAKLDQLRSEKAAEQSASVSQ